MSSAKQSSFYGGKHRKGGAVLGSIGSLIDKLLGLGRRRRKRGSGNKKALEIDGLGRRRVARGKRVIML